MRTQFYWKRFFALAAVLLGLGWLWVAGTQGKNREMIARRGGMHRLVSLLKDHREKFRRDPQSLHELCTAMQENHGGQLREILWPLWTYKYHGEPPPGWDPTKEKDSLMGAYELMPADEGVIVMEKENVVRRGFRFLVYREKLEIGAVRW